MLLNCGVRNRAIMKVYTVSEQQAITIFSIRGEKKAQMLKSVSTIQFNDKR